MLASTFSIVAYDAEAEAWGVAVQSKFLAVGAVVPWARAGVGALATQAWANLSYGPDGLHLLHQGLSAEEVVDRLVSPDDDRGQRQLGVIDAKGGAAAFTGEECLDWAGHVTGDGYTCQGNILAGEAVVADMASVYEESGGDLADRLLRALEAGQAAGGDSRGKESASLLVVKEGGSYGGWLDRMVDLRVDDHPDPIPELARILDLHRLYLGETSPEDVIDIDAALARELQSMMTRKGYYSDEIDGVWQGGTVESFRRFAGVENLEERLQDGPRIDRVVLDFLRERFGD
ncbi:MAG: DUF1028 domain-containing protein [Anaerolineae bacterium]